MNGLPFWLDEPYEARPPLRGDVEVEVCVIGAGVGGLSCARRLASHGIETLVLERGTVASGASGRNGGFLIAGVAAFHPTLVSAAGSRSRDDCTRARSTRRRRCTSSLPRWASPMRSGASACCA